MQVLGLAVGGIGSGVDFQSAFQQSGFFLLADWKSTPLPPPSNLPIK